MAKIARATQVIFGTTGLVGTGGFGAAAGGTVTTEVATSNTLATIMGATSWGSGWLTATLGATKYPAIEDMNALAYAESTQLAYIFQQGIPEYDAGTTYFANSLCMKTTTYQLYGSVTNSNLGNALSNATYWTQLIDFANSAGTLTGTTLASNVVTSSLVNFGGTGLGTWTFSQSNTGAATSLAILNNNTTTGTISKFVALTGTTNAYSIFEQIDGTTPSLSIITGGGNTGGITIDSSAASASPLTLKSGSGGFVMNGNAGAMTFAGGGFFGVNRTSPPNVISALTNSGTACGISLNQNAIAQWSFGTGASGSSFGFDPSNTNISAPVFQFNTSGAVIKGTFIGVAVSKSTGTIYQAATDLMVVAYSSGSNTITLVSDTSATPATIRQVGGNAAAGNAYGTISCVVLKGWYYEITGTAVAYVVYPVGG